MFDADLLEKVDHLRVRGRETLGVSAVPINAQTGNADSDEIAGNRKTRFSGVNVERNRVGHSRRRRSAQQTNCTSQPQQFTFENSSWRFIDDHFATRYPTLQTNQSPLVTYAEKAAPAPALERRRQTNPDLKRFDGMEDVGERGLRGWRDLRRVGVVDVVIVVVLQV